MTDNTVPFSYAINRELHILVVEEHKLGDVKVKLALNWL